MDRICKHCKQNFGNVNGKWFSNHVRWCSENPDRNNTRHNIEAIKSYCIKIFGDFKNFDMICSKCGKSFVVREREKLFPKKEKYFCSRSCSNSRIHTEVTKNKIQSAILSKIVPKILTKKICLYCNKEFTGLKKRIYCSKECHINDRKSSNEYLQYKCDCKFKFNVWDYPQEFDLNLIYKYGWYKPKNKGNNLGGVSRDHKISIKFGWENNISAEIIRHPANCKLMVHSENISKNKKCSLLLEELEREIKNWNFKYGLLV